MTATRTNNKVTVSLVLGSGGARGLAHIGVINWLEEHGFLIKAISGSSIGALVGGFYAADKLDAYTQWVLALNRRNVLRLLDFAFSRAGLFSGDKVMQTLEELLGDVCIEDLAISFTAVSADIGSNKEIWLNKGSLFEAIRASISVPTIFTPVRLNNMILVDGGLVNPIPIAPTVMNTTDLTIAVNLSGEDEIDWQEKNVEETLNTNGNGYGAKISRFIDNIQGKILPTEKSEYNMYEILTRSLEMMQITISRFKLAAYTPDYIIDIPSNAAHLLEFHRAEEMIELGYQRTEMALNGIKDKPKQNAID